MSGALPEAELPTLSAEAGLVRGQIVQRFESYADTSALERLSEDLHVSGVTFRAEKP